MLASAQCLIGGLAPVPFREKVESTIYQRCTIVRGREHIRVLIKLSEVW